MDFTQFPVDEQGCLIKFESFSYTVDEVEINIHYTCQFDDLVLLDAADVDEDGPAGQPQHLAGPV